MQKQVTTAEHERALGTGNYKAVADRRASIARNIASETKLSPMLDEMGIRVVVERSDNRPPTWADGKSVHGRHYLVTVSRYIDGEFVNVAPLRFDYWGSKRDSDLKVEPTREDVLICIASDSSCPQTADEVYSEFGEMLPSQAQTIAEWAVRLTEWFTPAELEELAKLDQ